MDGGSPVQPGKPAPGVFVLGKDLISIAFHLLALYYLYRGLKANEALTKLGGAAGA
jgi:hypothetical protein